MPKKLEVGKAYFRLGFSRVFEIYNPGWYRFELAWFRLKSLPPEGARISREDYSGFWLRVLVFFPFEIEK